MATDKRALLDALRDRVSAELEASTRRARTAAEAATHEENRAEGDKDMRATEASYIARGQAERVHELESALARLASMPIKSFADGEGVAVSALVEVSHGDAADHRTRYFLVLAAGGEKLATPTGDVLTLATTSPLGRALLGLTEGDVAEVTTAQGVKAYEVLAVE